MNITGRKIGTNCAVVELELGPPHNKKIDLGTFSKYALLRFRQELEHDMDYLNDVANKLHTPNDRLHGREGSEAE